MNESGLRDKVNKECVKQDIYVYKTVGTEYTTKGFPDMIWIKAGRCLLVELKVGNNELSTNQILVRNKLVSMGTTYCMLKRGNSDMPKYIANIYTPVTLILYKNKDFLPFKSNSMEHIVEIIANHM